MTAKTEGSLLMLIALVKLIVLTIGMEMVVTSSNIVIPDQPRTERMPQLDMNKASPKWIVR